MRRVLKALVLTAAVACVGAPAQARAEGFVSPWAGVNFSGAPSDGRKPAFGVNAGYMGAGIIGFEGSFGWAPDYFGNITSVDNREYDLMGNLIVGIPIGGTRGAGIRPFVTGGLGVINTNFDFPDAGRNEFGYNLGAGVMGYFATHIGVRADVRYLRTINSDGDINIGDGLDSFGNGSFHIWRATIGIVIK